MMSNWKHCKGQQKEDYFLFVSKALALETIQSICYGSVSPCCWACVWQKSSAVHLDDWMQCARSFLRGSLTVHAVTLSVIVPGLMHGREQLVLAFLMIAHPVDVWQGALWGPTKSRSFSIICRQSASLREKIPIICYAFSMIFKFNDKKSWKKNKQENQCMSSLLSVMTDTTFVLAHALAMFW